MFAFTNAEVKKALNSHFEDRILERGRTYYHDKAVSNLKVEPSEDGWTMSASVDGSDIEPYETEVFLTREGADLVIDANCSCPMGGDCKHCVATLVAATNEQHRAQLQTDAVGIAPRPNLQVLPAPTPSALPPEWTRWLQRVEAASAPKESDSEDYPADEKQRLLYILKRQPDTGILLIEFAIAPLLENGAFGHPGGYFLPNILSNSPPNRFIRPIDQRIARKIALANGPSAYQLKIEGRAGAELLAEILATGRCKWQGATQQHRVLLLGETRAAKAVWKLTDRAQQQPAFEINPPVTEILRLSPLWYLDETTSTSGPLASDLPAGIAEAWLSAPVILPEQTALLTAELPKRNLGTTLPAPKRIEIEIIKNLKPVCHLRLHSIPDPRSIGMPAQKYIHLAHLEFDYNGIRVPNNCTAHPLERIEGENVVRLIRDTESEFQVRMRFITMKMCEAGSLHVASRIGKNKDDFTFINETGWLPFLLETIPQLRAEGWHIEVDPDFQFRIAQAEDWYADAESTGINWFGVEIGVQVDGEKINLLPLLLQELRKQPGMLDPESLAKLGDNQFIPVYLPDGRVLPFPAKRLREMLGVWLELFDDKPLDPCGRLKLSKLRAAELSAVAEDARWRWLGGEELRQLSQKLHSFKGIQAVEPSKNFKAELRPYQCEGLSWLQFLREYELAGILADDMGLGKTVQALAHLLHEKESGRADRPSLVVAPTSLMTNWRQETERFAPGLKLLVLHGTERKQHFQKLRDYDLIVTSYPLLVRDEAILLKERFHYIILDEAQYIKNPKTKFAQIACQLQAQHRLCLTGTPMENHLGELWSQFNFLLPGFLADEVRFRQLFRNPIERSANNERRKLLARRVAPFILRRRKEEVAKDLPPKTEIVQNVELSGGQRDLYEMIRLAMHAKVREEVSTKGFSRAHIVILDALLKLRQVCCDPRLVKLDSARKVQDSAKFELLMDLLPEMIAEGRRILLFSQFTSMLALIEAELRKLNIPYALLTGETTDRATPIDNFQKGKVPLFLISLKAGGTGLNLTAADTVIHYDPWWNPAVENQATDRAHRIGQTKSVFVYKLMTVGTVEERIFELQKRKQELVEGLFDENRKDTLKLTSEDLDVLFAPLDE